MFPLVLELEPLDPFAALLALHDLPGVVLFESTLHREPLGQYSFLTADPFWQQSVQVSVFGLDPFFQVRQQLSRFSTQSVPGLPPFQGGAAGLLCYELGRCWERLPRTNQETSTHFETIPAAVIGLYDWTLAWDHVRQKLWIISQGFPETDPVRRHLRAKERMQQIQSLLKPPLKSQIRNPKSQLRNLKSDISNSQSAQGASFHCSPLISNFTRPAYLEAVEKVREYIRAGDLFQANLSQQFKGTISETHHPGLSLYGRLKAVNPAPFAGYFAAPTFTVISSSPERFLKVDERRVETRPIKGTRRRAILPEADLFTQDELRESEKDRAENVMIVDLLRNDLSKVCRPNSIRVSRLCEVETYETVQHLVSEVRGELADGEDFWSLMRATFPGGSITGAPKVRAMEIITELEQIPRGPYCGCLFYNGFDGRADANILIRTFTIVGDQLTFSVGGGITMLSEPSAEYEETQIKATGLRRALS